MSLSVAEKRELDELLLALCEDKLGSQPAMRLRKLLTAHEDAQRIYLAAMDIHAGLAWELAVRRSADRPTVAHAARPAARFRPFGLSVSAMAAMAGLFLLLSLVAIVPAYLSLHRAELENAQREQREAQERQLAANKVREAEAAERKARENSRAFNGAYAKLLSEQNPLPAARAVRDSVAWVYAHGLGQARLTFAVDCRWRGAVPDVGEALTLGRRLQLKSGLAEIVFQNGARTILQGPATLQILSGSGAFLQIGRYTVNVDDPRAKGFVVGTPGMKYTDLGTEFGVMVDADGEQEMHVFRGRVEAEQAQSREPTRSLFLTAHEAIRVDAAAAPGEASRPIERMAADDRQFVREMPRERFPLAGTGVGLDGGAADPNWEITAISTDPPLYRENKLGKPQQVVVLAKPNQGFVQGQRDKAQWISNSGTGDNMPGGCRWTLRTHFDLTGLEPSSARIEAHVAVDDYLVEVRLNGKKVPIPAHTMECPLCFNLLPMMIESGFTAGENTLEFVIENEPESKSVGGMALYLELKEPPGGSRSPRAEYDGRDLKFEI